MNRWTLVFGVLACASVISFFGCGQTDSPIAHVKLVHGAVQTRFSLKADFSPAKEDDALAVGGAVKTGEDASAQIVFLDKGEAAVKPESYFEVGSGQNLGKQVSGAAVYRVNKQKDSVKVETPQGVTAVLGTVFRLDVSATQTTVIVDEGRVAFTNQAGNTAEVNPGQKLVANAQGALSAPTALDPVTRDALFNPQGGAVQVNPR
ncbi:MAG: FecR family protein [Candidatus Ozemobacteraceae bacterium]